MFSVRVRDQLFYNDEPTRLKAGDKAYFHRRDRTLKFVRAGRTLVFAHTNSLTQPDLRIETDDLSSSVSILRLLCALSGLCLEPEEGDDQYEVWIFAEHVAK